MDVRIIKHPSPATLEILDRRRGSREPIDLPEIDAIGLCQGKLIDMIVASDIAQKTVGIHVEDIRGSCPQNMILLAIYGETAAVEEAIDTIGKRLMKKG